MYETLSLWLRYFFAGFAVIFVIRAWIITVRDNRRARTIRSWLPETGTIGEWLVIAGASRIRKGTRLPILNEGMIGSARRADIRILHGDIKAEHAYFIQHGKGLRIHPVMDAPVQVEAQHGGVFYPSDGYVEMNDGDILILGEFKMVLTLFNTGRENRTIIVTQEPETTDRSSFEKSVPGINPLDEQLDELSKAAQAKRRKDTSTKTNNSLNKKKKSNSTSQKDAVKLELPWQDEEDWIPRH
ncbi:MAG: hypothetical protein E7335_04670 [Clostridiales bacterium]|nr:hypothetical protein [Clostridiales bacterium]